MAAAVATGRQLPTQRAYDLVDVRPLGQLLRTSLVLVLRTDAQPLRVPFDAIRSISRRTGEGALVTLLDGRQIVSTFARRPIFGYRFVAYSSLAIAIDRPEGAEVVRTSLVFDEVVATAIPMVEKNGNRFSVHCACRDYVLTSDATRLRQVIINLLSNYESLYMTAAAYFANQPGETQTELEQ